MEKGQSIYIFIVQQEKVEKSVKKTKQKKERKHFIYNTKFLILSHHQEYT